MYVALDQDYVTEEISNNYKCSSGYQHIRMKVARTSENQEKAYLNPKTSQSWIEEYEEVIRGINGFINYIFATRKAH